MQRYCFVLSLIIVAAIFSVNLHSTGALFRTFHYRIQPIIKDARQLFSFLQSIYLYQPEGI